MNNEPTPGTKEPKTKYTWKDPFDTPTSYEKGLVGRVQCDIPKEIFNRFRAILPYREDALWQTTFSILIHKLLTELDRYGINSIDDADAYKQFIIELTILNGSRGSEPRKLANIPRSPTLRIVREAVSSDDGRGKDGKGSRDSGK